MFIGELSLGWIAALMAAGMALDLLLGEARRWHPLVGFGRIAVALEKVLNHGGLRRGRGLLAWLIAVLPPVILCAWLADLAMGYAGWLGGMLQALVLYFCIGLRSLADHALPIADALASKDLPQARALTSRIVSRDTADAEAPDLAKAGVESLLENGNDAVFGTLFWFIVAGAPGALLFRLANTLDAMWGYRNARFHAFGCVSARIDDVLNWIPARLTALSYLILGNARAAWRCWRTQAPAWSSPNAGPVMAAGAGALGVSLGGAARYEGRVEMRPVLGMGPAATADDIRRAWKLVLRTSMLWLALTVSLALIKSVMHA